MLRNYRKPLIIASPKTLLRAVESRSALSDFEEGTSFKPILSYGEGD
jgi:probable 2-oxoglutarate dehydrogenase E1 component DHKTD1